MNGNLEPIEIKVEPEIHDLLPFEDFDIDQFVDYLQNDDEIASNNNPRTESTPSPVPQTGYTNNFASEPATQPAAEKLFYTCTVCRDILVSSKELLRHVRTHTRLKQLSAEKNSHNGPKCCICHKRFSDFKMLQNHEKSQHTPPFRCRFCSSMFSALKFYKIHLNFHKRRSNVPDRKTMQSSSNNKQWNKSGAHSNVHASHANAYRTSSVQTSSNQGLLMQQLNYPKHQNSYASPPPQQSMRCKYCPKQFGKISSLKKHEMVHESIEARPNVHLAPEVVDLVGMRNRSMSRSSNEHMNMNNKSGALTLTPSLLSNLNKLANLGTSDGRDGKKPAILININTNDSSAKDETALKSQEMPVGGSASGLMISSVSSVDKNYYEKLEKNVQGGGKSTVMIQNGKKAISLADLQCPICKKIVSQPFSLKIHLRTHTMERPFSCSVCGKRFSQSCNLKTHMKTHSVKRPPQQPMQCNICKKVFSRASSLNSHMISHTAKLYCYACNINFDEDVLQYSQHMQSKHLVTMTKDCMSRTRINLQQQQSENVNQHRLLDESLASIVKVEPPEEPILLTEKQPAPQAQRIMEVFQVQSSNVSNGQIPKLKITLKKEPMQEAKKSGDGNESDSSSSSSSNSSSSSSSSGSSSSSSSSSNDGQDNNKVNE